MQVLKDEVRAKILKEAKDLFVKHGFEKASMNMIARRAEVSKSNLYNYFCSKEEIFYRLTGKAYDQIDTMFKNLLKHDELFNLDEFTSSVSQELMRLLTEYREEILLIVDCSKGTRFENVKDEFINRLQEHSLFEFKKFNITMGKDDYFFAHYVAASLVEGLLEIIRHKKSDDWIKDNIKMLVGYYISGYSFFFKEVFR